MFLNPQHSVRKVESSFSNIFKKIRQQCYLYCITQDWVVIESLFMENHWIKNRKDWLLEILHRLCKSFLGINYQIHIFSLQIYRYTKKEIFSFFRGKDVAFNLNLVSSFFYILLVSILKRMSGICQCLHRRRQFLRELN